LRSYTDYFEILDKKSITIIFRKPMMNPILKKVVELTCFTINVFIIFYLLVTYSLISKSHLFVVTSINYIRIYFYKNQILKINSVFVGRRLKVSLTLSSLITTN